MRARVTAAMAELETQKLKVVEFREGEHRCPANGDDGFGAPGDYAGPFIATVQLRAAADGECVIDATLAGTTATALVGKHLRATLDAQGRWRYDSDVAQRYLPLALRRSSSAP